jgi:hypothetical protein
MQSKIIYKIGETCSYKKNVHAYKKNVHCGLKKNIHVLYKTYRYLLKNSNKRNMKKGNEQKRNMRQYNNFQCRQGIASSVAVTPMGNVSCRYLLPVNY